MKREAIAVAHGRVNLIGEHTDYNGGFVLPALIPQKTEARLLLREDRRVIASSHGFAHMEYELGEERVTHQWHDYLQGVTAVCLQSGLRLRGFEVHIESTVPVGSGLSSSAALEISVLKALNEIFEWRLDGVQLARIGQRAENEFVGARVGIMDQMVCCLGRPGEALFIDTRSLRVRRLPLPLDRIELLVINSGVVHSNAHGGYNERRRECEQACAELGIESLRELSEKDLPRLLGLSGARGRRARHVITENTRVLAAVDALEASDFARLGELFFESHVSMRDDYEVSVPEIDVLVDIARRDPAVHGARLTGGGFGGSIVALTQPGKSLEAGHRIIEEYKLLTGGRPTLLVPEEASPKDRGKRTRSTDQRRSRSEPGSGPIET